MQTFKHINIKYLFAGALILVGALLVYWSSSSSKTEEDRQGVVDTELIIHPATVMQADLYENLGKTDAVSAISEQVYGGIVSHHFYMEKEISKLFLSWRSQKPSVVVIVGPNHFSAGRGDILISKAQYNTPFGTLEPSTELANKLLQSGAAFQEEDPFTKEHAIGAVVGFTKKVFPDTQVLPIILRRNTSPERTENLAQTLALVLPKDALVIASVDFSHHLDRFAAELHDAQSVAALKSADIDRIRNIEVDSPQSLEVLTRYLQSRGALRLSLMNTNQALYGGNLLSDDVTSYAFATFTKGESIPQSAATFLHYGLFAKSNLELEDGTGLYGIGGPENNFLRGVDLKVAGVIASDCNFSLPALTQYAIKPFGTGECPLSKLSSPSYKNTSIGFINIADVRICSDAQTVSRECIQIDSLKKQHVRLVVQLPSPVQAKRAIDLGADAVFVEDSTPKVEVYKSKPIIHLASPGESGFSTGIVFNAAPKLYIFPYETDGSRVVRPNIATRLEQCRKIVAGFAGADGCALEIK